MNNYENLFESFLAASIGIILVLAVLVIAIAVFYIVCNWKLFKKCGVDGWKSIIPFYNTYTMIVDIASLNWWWFLISLGCSLASNNDSLGSIFALGSLFVNFVAYFNIAKKFNKSTAFAIGCTLLPIIFVPILALGNNNKFDKGVKVSANGPF